jgi:RecA-family ATPase
MAEVKPIRPAQAAYPVTWVADAVLDFTVPSIVKGLIDPGAFVVIYGPSGSGKSFFTADIAEHIATGSPWRGRKTLKGLVVYVASEAGASILKRFVGWRENRLGDSADPFLPLAVLTRGPNLLNTVDIEKLCEQLQALQLEAKLPLALVIFDTLSRSIPGGDENSAEDMTMAVNAADYLREKFNRQRPRQGRPRP